ncbi:unnamed protein product [Prorocentrum cordatum]|uniref:Kinesin-like protein n=1 Tax=Prorocentrum cordatum TaxID=2364126 RepID=A0ABN9UGL5_9DINO|nr:unnamed protein product [Polarella glacialis]
MTKVAGGRERTSRFLFVDLAGSERTKASNVQGLGVQEAKNINLSLSSLGRCISALRQTGTSGRAAAAPGSFVPWRDSALTMLMKQSLSGNCRTALCVCVAEDAAWASETISSLRFGLTCGDLKTSACAVESRDADQERAGVQARLQEIGVELAELVNKGAHGHVDPSFPRTTAQGFVDNFKNLRITEGELVRSKLAANATQQAALEQTINSLKGVVIRQITTGLWKEPTKGWRIKMDERRGLLQEQERLCATSGKSPPVLGSELADGMSCMSLYDLTRDFTG